MNHATPAVGPNTAISPEVVSHVKAVAASMIGHAAFQKCDFDDICQELFQQIILATPKFNPEKSSFDTYACLIADRYKNRIYRVRIHVMFRRFRLKTMAMSRVNTRLIPPAIMSSKQCSAMTFCHLWRNFQKNRVDSVKTSWMVFQIARRQKWPESSGATSIKTL